MPDISAADLRRLRRIEGAAARAEEQRKEWTAERARTRRELRDAERRNAASEDQVTELVAQNRQLAERLDSATADVTTTTQAAREAREALERVQAEASQLRDRVTVAEQGVQRLETELARARPRIDDLRKQLAAQGKLEVLGPDDVAALVDGLLTRLRTQLPSIGIRGGRLGLKLAFAGVGDTRGFVVPAPDGPSVLGDSLQEITVQFGAPPEREG